MSQRLTPEQFRSLNANKPAKSKRATKKPKPEPEQDEPLMSGQHTESQIRQVFNCLTDAKVLRLLSEIGFVFVDVGAETLKLSDGKNNYIITIKTEK